MCDQPRPTAAPTTSPIRQWAARHGIDAYTAEWLQFYANQAAIQGEKECNGDPHPQARDKRDKNACAKLWGSNRDFTLEIMAEMLRRIGNGFTVEVNGLRPSIHQNGRETFLP